jgi:hypothetical protein
MAGSLDSQAVCLMLHAFITNYPTQRHGDSRKIGGISAAWLAILPSVEQVCVRYKYGALGDVQQRLAETITTKSVSVWRFSCILLKIKRISNQPSSIFSAAPTSLNEEMAEAARSAIRIKTWKSKKLETKRTQVKTRLISNMPPLRNQWHHRPSRMVDIWYDHATKPSKINNPN